MTVNPWFSVRVITKINIINLITLNPKFVVRVRVNGLDYV